VTISRLRFQKWDMGAAKRFSPQGKGRGGGKKEVKKNKNVMYVREVQSLH